MVLLFWVFFFFNIEARIDLKICTFVIGWDPIVVVGCSRRPASTGLTMEFWRGCHGTTQVHLTPGACSCCVCKWDVTAAGKVASDTGVCHAAGWPVLPALVSHSHWICCCVKNWGVSRSRRFAHTTKNNITIQVLWGGRWKKDCSANFSGA